MAAAKLLGKRTHQVPGIQSLSQDPDRNQSCLDPFPGKINVSELFFEVPKDHSNPSKGSLRLFARSAERFEKPVDASKKEVKQQPWCREYF